MKEQFYRPWIGSNYSKSRVLLMGESAYAWKGADQRILSPTPNHPSVSVRWAIEKFGPENSSYFNAMTRTVCGKEHPSRKERETAWDNYAYSIYVPGSVGKGATARPTKRTWDAGKPQFLSLIEELRPRKVIVSEMTWTKMPDCCCAELTETLQAYALQDGQLVWCLAIPHPSNRQKGFQWERYSKVIALFRSMSLPKDCGALPFSRKEGAALR